MDRINIIIVLLTLTKVMMVIRCDDGVYNKNVANIEEFINALPGNTFTTLLTASKLNFGNPDDNNISKTTNSLYDYRNKQDLAKVIQNILLLHLKNNQKIASGKNCNATICDTTTTVPMTTTTTPTIPISSSAPITTTYEIMANTTQTEQLETIRNLVKNEILLKLKAKNMGYSTTPDSADKIYVYFIISIIFLSLLVLLLIIILSVCCVIYYKQKARLDYYLNENYFTYFNNKQPPIVPNGSTFTLTEQTPERHNGEIRQQQQHVVYDPVTAKGKIMEKLPISEEKLAKLGNNSTLRKLDEATQVSENEVVSSISKKQSFRIMNKCKANFINLNGLDAGNNLPPPPPMSNHHAAVGNAKTVINIVQEQIDCGNSNAPVADDDDEDLILESDLALINNLNMFSTTSTTIPKQQIQQQQQQSDFNYRNNLNKEPPPPTIVTESSVSFADATAGSEISTCVSSTEMMQNNVRVAASSPTVMRDRYYKLLREQVFPYLHRSTPPPPLALTATNINNNNSNNMCSSITTSKQVIEVNDVLY